MNKVIKTVVSRSLWRRVALLVLVVIAILCWFIRAISDDPEIALVYGEPWEDMRKRSSASIDPAIPNQIWFAIPDSDARLSLVDPQYGFVTPVARFFTIGFINERVTNVRISPQTEPLLLDDALKIVLDLQDQWRQQGWFVSRPKSSPPFADTPQWRAQLRNVNTRGRTYWQAGNKYKIMLLLGRFKDKKRPEEERYMITLALSEPRDSSDED